MGEESKYTINGATQREKAHFKKQKGVTFEEETIPNKAIGEPATFTMIVTASAISALAAYLLRKYDGESFEEEIREELPDGTVRLRKVKWKKVSSEAPEKEIIEQIQSPLSLIDKTE